MEVVDIQLEGHRMLTRAGRGSPPCALLRFVTSSYLEDVGKRRVEPVNETRQLEERSETISIARVGVLMDRILDADADTEKSILRICCSMSFVQHHCTPKYYRLILRSNKHA